jgi:lipopolysaccharide/colanic/teichoic acid biosynthesis glycosyltransferase
VLSFNADTAIRSPYTGPEEVRGGVPRWSDRAMTFRFAKRVIDLAVVIPLFALTFPIQVLIAVLIRLDSAGPSLFRQTRLGLDRQPFILLKFRTMFVDARAKFPDLYDYAKFAQSDGRLPLKLNRDPRLTRIGVWLRRTSLDELPNLWNVIRGEMSLVGPRPEIPELLSCYSEEELQIFYVRPGVTGLPQTRGRNRLTVAETIRLDLYYARHASIGLDNVILLRSVLPVLVCRDAY